MEWVDKYRGNLTGDLWLVPAPSSLCTLSSLGMNPEPEAPPARMSTECHSPGVDSWGGSAPALVGVRGTSGHGALPWDCTVTTKGTCQSSGLQNTCMQLSLTACQSEMHYKL